MVHVLFYQYEEAKSKIIMKTVKVVLFFFFLTQQDHAMVINTVAWLSLINIFGFAFYIGFQERK